MANKKDKGKKDKKDKDKKDKKDKSRKDKTNKHREKGEDTKGASSPHPAGARISDVVAELPVSAEVSVVEALALRSGPVDLAELDTRGIGIGPQSRSDAERRITDLAPTLAGLQEKLYAQGISGDRRRVLLILQGTDTSGKDGVVKHVMGLVNPAGLQLTSFKKPTPEELAHNFLWRIENQIPGSGLIGVFNRSQYEDVLVVRVHELVSKAVWSKRFAEINAFERRLARQGVTVLKCFLHISRAEQKERLIARLDDPTKYWKYNPGDVDERARWDDYQLAYADALRRCNTAGAPWYVIPADHKWYRNWAIGALLAQTLERIDPHFPPPNFDLAAERVRVIAS